MKFFKKRVSSYSLEKILDFITIAGITGILFVRPLVSGIVYPGSNCRFLIAIVVLFFVTFLRKIVSTRITIRINVFLVLNCLFLVWALVSSFSSINKYESLLFLLQFGGYFLLYFVLLNTDISEKNLQIITGSIVAAGILVSFYGIHQFVFGLKQVQQWAHIYLNMDALPDSFESRLHSLRVFSTFVYPNALGGYLILILPLTVLFYSTLLTVDRGRKIKGFLIVLISMTISSVLLVEPWMNVVAAVTFLIFPVLPVISLLLSVSKGAIVSFSLAILVSCFFLFRKEQWMKYLVFLIVGLLVATAFFYSVIEHDFVWKRLFDTFQKRVQYWIASADIIKEWPVWGTGPGTFGNIYGAYKLPGAEETRMAHNNYLQVANETGIIGGVLFLAMWCSVLVLGMRVVKERIIQQKKWWLAAGFWIGLAAFFVHNLFDFDLYVPGIALTAWVFAALLFGQGRCYRELRLPRIGSMGKIVAILSVWGISIVLILMSRNVLLENTLKEKGRMYLQKKDWLNAQLCFREAINRMPLDSQNYYFLSRIAVVHGNSNDAISYQKKVVSLNPFSSMMHYSLAQIYRQYYTEANRKEYIQHHLEKAVNCFPTKDFYHLELGAFLESVGAYENAEEQYYLALRYGANEKDILSRIINLRKKIKELYQ